MTASPLHRVVPSAHPFRAGIPPRDGWILPGHRGHTPTRIARRPGPHARETSTGWIHTVMQTPCRSLQAPRRRFSPRGHALYRAHANGRRPATIYIQKRTELRPPDWADMRPCFSFVASGQAWNGPDQWLATWGLTITLDAAASPLHRVVPRCGLAIATGPSLRGSFRRATQ